MKPGLYEQILTLAMEQDLIGHLDPRLYDLISVDPEDSHHAIAQFLERILVNKLSMFRGQEAVERQIHLASGILKYLREHLKTSESEFPSIASPLRRLLAIHQTTENAELERPNTPLSRSALLTGTRLDPSLGSQLLKELTSCDRVDILCSFVKWSGLRIILPGLQALSKKPSETGPTIRVITTSYMGATDTKAIECLRELPNTEIRVSYDTKRTRLHAKAYLFHRNTGFGSAYVGSANLSNAALSEGLEWTTKLSQYELPYMWERITGTFETYWLDNEFEEYNSDSRDRLRRAISQERSSSEDSSNPYVFDLRPYPFQEEVLDILDAERKIQHRSKHLIVAATGTGKTLIAAFDYARISRALGKRPSLLFVVHREEILRQAISSFRAVLRDQNFGDLLVGGESPEQEEHLFCSIQSYNSQELWRRNSKTYSYVVVDEFHHAAAPSYQRLLEHVQPETLLGLTATPERSDQIDVLKWFGDRISVEIRLPNAINRRLLCPFQYFGVSDSVDLDSLGWQRNGYKTEDLDRVYTGNVIRANLIVEKTAEYLLNPLQARGLGFCVSIAHAEFMAKYFTEHGIPAMVLTARSEKEERRKVQERLRNREINFIFVVDLYNEGVDIPEVDTVLFLRPTESLTVFLQQLGRGLRLHDEKDCLTVLDFIGAQRREFRFAERFRALGTNLTGSLEDEIEGGFPYLPSGCAIRLERVAQKRVLENIKNSVSSHRSRIVEAVRELGYALGRTPTLEECIEYSGLSLDDVFKRGLWSQLLFEAKLADKVDAPDADRLGRGIHRLLHIDDADRILHLLSYLDGTDTKPSNQRILEMLHVTLWGNDSVSWTLHQADEQLRRNPSAMNDLRAVLRIAMNRASVHPAIRNTDVSGPLAVHCHYTRDEILVGLGDWTLSSRPPLREGVRHIRASKVDALFATLQKTQANYSPTTMYEDYLVSSDIFHWQSQNRTSQDSETGRRYINHIELGYTPLLFVREVEELPSGLKAPYAFLGPCLYMSHTDNSPMNILWKLNYPVPARLFRQFARQATG